MNHGDQILLALLSRSLFGTATNHIPEEVVWETVYQEAKAHAVQPLVFDCLTACERDCMPQELAAQWRQDTMSVLVRNQKVSHCQEEALQVMESASIPCVILKGSSSAEPYPKPELRALGDVDLLVLPDEQQAAVAALEAAGYTRAACADHPFHITLQKNGISVEVHREPNGITRSGAFADRLNAYFADAVARRHGACLPEDAQAVSLLLHKMNHFLAGELGLRQLCDWAVFVGQKMTPVIWKSVEPLLKRVGLLYFTGVITRVCVEALGLPEERAPWAMEYPLELSREVLEEILASGNFSSKRPTLGQWYFVDPEQEDALHSFFSTIGPSCRKHYPPCRKYPMLLPIGFLAVCWNYLKKVIAGEGMARHPLQLIRQSGPKRRLYRSLRPFATEAGREQG